MRKRSKWTKIATGILLLIFSSVLTVTAAQEQGSITIQLEDGELGTSKEGVVFACEKVANLDNGEYELTETFKDSEVDLNQLEYAEDMNVAVKKLLSYVAEADIKITTDVQGNATMEGLEPGVYLIWAINQKQYDVTSPALVSIPEWNEDETEMRYDITVVPKHSPVPENPKTGDDNQIWLYGGGMIVTAGICAVTLLRRKKTS